MLRFFLNPGYYSHDAINVRQLTRYAADPETSSKTTSGLHARVCITNQKTSTFSPRIFRSCDTRLFKSSTVTAQPGPQWPPFVNFQLFEKHCDWRICRNSSAISAKYIRFIYIRVVRRFFAVSNVCVYPRKRYFCRLQFVHRGVFYTDNYYYYYFNMQPPFTVVGSLTVWAYDRSETLTIPA